MKRVLVTVLSVGLFVGCSKHECKVEGKQELYWKDIANATEGATYCIVSVNPNGCKLGDDRCTPTLNAIHAETTQAATEKRYRSSLEKQGWTYVGEEVAGDKSKGMAFKKGKEDELIVSFGTSSLSNSVGGDGGIDVFMLRKPEGAPGSMLDKYAFKPADKK